MTSTLPNKPILLDLFCKAGGCTKGYQQAGFYVIGVDIQPQPHYIGDEFYQEDALVVLDILLSGGAWHGYHLQDFAAFHGSPECKSYTHSNRPNQKSSIVREDYLRLIEPVQSYFRATGKPYVIENVMGAKYDLSANLLLAGSMFGLPMARERLFEIGGINRFFIVPPRPRDKSIEHISVVGHSVWDSRLVGTTRRDGRRRPDSVSIEIGRAAMGIAWMNIEEMSQAIPPAYTQHIGTQILHFLETQQREHVVASLDYTNTDQSSWTEAHGSEAM